MQLREGLRLSDRPALARLLRSIRVFREGEIAVAMELVDIGLSDPDRGYRFIVADDGAETVLGYACWGWAPMTDGVYDLYWIAVDPVSQGRGIGKRILRAVEEAVVRDGGRMLLIETEGSPAYQATRRFYERAGYAEIARIRDYYRVGADKVIYGRAFQGARTSET